MTQYEIPTKNRSRIVSEGRPVEQDRLTVVLTVHYQEYDTPVTQARWAYDRLLPVENKPFQLTMRVNPGTRKPINIGDNEWGKAAVVLGHANIRISDGSLSAELLKESQKSNIISIFNAEGVLVGTLDSNGMMFGKFAGPLFAESSTTTALLEITACPS